MIVLLSLVFNLVFTDMKTGERLTGVEVRTDKNVYYSNLDGEVSIPDGEVVKKVSMVSYTTIDTTLNKSAVIYLK